MYGNGWFVIDEQHFKCSYQHAQKSKISYFHKLGDTVTLFVDMESKIAKLESYTIHLPDIVQIAINSASNHVVTVI